MSELVSKQCGLFGWQLHIMSMPRRRRLRLGGYKVNIVTGTRRFSTSRSSMTTTEPLPMVTLFAFLLTEMLWVLTLAVPPPRSKSL